MSEPKNVMVCVGGGKNPKIPRQSYNSHLFTRYNIGMDAMGEADFYNLGIRRGIPKNPDKHIFIYGFINSRYSYVDENSIREIVSFFERDEDIQVVTSDILIRTDIDGVEHLSHRCIHMSDLPNVPFFVRDSAAKSLNFSQGDSIFEKQLKNLQASGHIIFHIAKPLLVAEGAI